MRYDVIVIGAGPAGLSAAIYASRAGKRVLVLEGKSYGGQIINTPKVENYPGIREISGFGFATDLLEQVKALGVEILYERCIGMAQKEKQPGSSQGQFAVFTRKETFDCQSVVLAVGAVNRKLGLEREEDLTGKGVSYCATCDGIFFRGKDVAVVGGGNTALEDALFLAGYCKTVSIIHRRNEFRGERRREKLLREKENVHFYLEQTVSSIQGEEHLHGLILRHVRTGQEMRLPVEGLFIAVGQMPDTQCFSGFLQMNEGGYVVAGEDCQTNVPGVLVAGDCRNKQVRQLTTAVADGSVAALAACAYCDDSID